MEPTNEELATFVSVTEIFTWLEMESDLISALKLAVGATTSTLRTWARIPVARYESLVRNLKIKVEGAEVERALTPVEEGQVGEVRVILDVIASRARALPATGTPAPAGRGHVPPGEAEQTQGTQALSNGEGGLPLEPSLGGAAHTIAGGAPLAAGAAEVQEPGASTAVAPQLAAQGQRASCPESWATRRSSWPRSWTKRTIPRSSP